MFFDSKKIERILFLVVGVFLLTPFFVLAEATDKTINRFESYNLFFDAGFTDGRTGNPEYTAGQQIGVRVTIDNVAKFCLNDGLLVYDLVKGGEKPASNQYSSQAEIDGENIFQEVSQPLSICPGEVKNIPLTIKLPDELSAGQYRVDLYVKSPRLSVRGNHETYSPAIYLPFKIREVAAGHYPGASIVRTKTRFAGGKFQVGPIVKPSIAQSGFVTVKNSSGEELDGNLVIKVCAYSELSDLGCQNSYRYDVNVGANSESTVNYKLATNISPDVYSVYYELYGDDGQLLSIYKNRFIVKGGSANLRAISANKSSYKKGEDIKIQASVSGPYTYGTTGEGIKDVDLIIDLYDTSGLFERKIFSRSNHYDNIAGNSEMPFWGSLEAGSNIESYRLCGTVRVGDKKNETRCVTSGGISPSILPWPWGGVVAIVFFVLFVLVTYKMVSRIFGQAKAPIAIVASGILLSGFLLAGSGTNARAFYSYLLAPNSGPERLPGGTLVEGGSTCAWVDFYNDKNGDGTPQQEELTKLFRGTDLGDGAGLYYVPKGTIAWAFRPVLDDPSAVTRTLHTSTSHFLNNGVDTAYTHNWWMIAPTTEYDGCAQASVVCDNGSAETGTFNDYRMNVLDNGTLQFGQVTENSITVTPEAMVAAINANTYDNSMMTGDPVAIIPGIDTVDVPSLSTVIESGDVSLLDSYIGMDQVGSNPAGQIFTNFETRCENTNPQANAGTSNLASASGASNLASVFQPVKNFTKVLSTALAQFSPSSLLANLISVSSATNYAVGANPRRLATGDFNGDGYKDLAVPNYGGNTVSIWLGSSTGTFTAGTAITLSYSNPYSVTAVDINGDGKLDLAVTLFANARMAIYFGTGSGTFTLNNTYVTGNGPTYVAAGYFNSDSYIDLAVSNNTSNNLSIFLGSSTYTFTTGTSVTTGTNPIFVVAADINNDSKTDLLTANYTSNSVSIHIRTGDNTFTTTSISTPTYTYGIAVGDYNGDGYKDLAVIGNGSSYVYVYSGTGTGTFGTGTTYAVGSTPIAVATDDLDGDGKLDLAVANYSSNNVSVLLGTGSGTFNSATNYTAGSNPFFVVLGDFNSNGKADIAVSNYSSTNVSVFLITLAPSAPAAPTGVAGNTQATISWTTVTSATGYKVYRNTTTSTTGATEITSVCTITINGSTASCTNTGLTNGTDYYYFVKAYNAIGDSDYSPASGKVTPVSSSMSISSAVNYSVSTPIHVATGDFNGDGKIDLAITKYSSSSGGIYIYLGDGAGNFTAGTSITGLTYLYYIITDDFNNDGKLDLIVTRYYSTGIAYVYLGTGSGTFTAGTSLTGLVSPMSIAIGDFNGDGNKDLAISNQTSISIFLGTGSGTFTTGTAISGLTSTYHVTAGDFNVDGKTDLMVTSYGGNTVTPLWGTGSGTFTTGTAISGFTNPYSVVGGDFNSDGKLDMAVTNYTGTAVSVLLGTGGGAFGTKTNYAVGTSPNYVIAGDFSGDGKLDLAVSNFSSNTLSILTGTGSGTFSAAMSPAPTTGSGPRVSMGDFNNNGKPDLVTANYNSSNISVFLITLAPSAPAAPTGVAGNTQATISWTTVTSATGYKVYRNTTTSTTGATEITSVCTITINGSTASCTNTGLTNGTDYYYFVKAYNAIGDSDYSSASNKVTPSDPLPLAPSGLTATAGDAQVSLGWTAGSGATSYKVYRGTSSGFTLGTPIGTPTSVSYVDTTALNGHLYYYKVTSVNAAGDSTTASNEVSAAPSLLAPASAPTAVTGTSQVFITGWSAVTGATKYRLYKNTDGYVSQIGSDITTIPTTGSPLSVTGLTNGTAYTFKVSGVTSDGYEGPKSVAGTAVTPVALPTSVVAVAGDQSVSLSWSASAGATGYYVYSSSDGYTNKINTVTTQSPYTVSGLTNGTAYTFKVSGANDGGEGDKSAVSNSVTPVPIPPGTPTAPIAVAGNGQVLLEWTTVSGATDYRIFRNTTDVASGTDFIEITAGCSVTINGSVASCYDLATNGTSFYYFIKASNLGGESSYSVASNVATPQYPPNVPTSVVANAGAGQVVLSFSTPVIDATHGAPEGYYLYSSTDNVTYTKFNTVPLTSDFVVTGLSNEVPYWFKVSATNVGGEGGLSDASASVMLESAPGAPSAPEVVAGNGQVLVRWTTVASADSYRVFRNTSASSVGSTDVTASCSVEIDGATASCYNTGLTNGETYYYFVKAVNTGGDSDYSPASSGVTPVAPPTTPSAPSGVAGDTIVRLSWTAVSGATGYNIYWSGDGGSSYTKLNSTPLETLSGTVSGLVNGNEYYFKLSAVNSGGESGLSPASVALKPVHVVMVINSAVRTVIGAYPYFVTINNLDTDANADLAVGNWNTSNNLYSYLGTGNGTTFNTSSIRTAGMYTISVAVGDYNNDGKKDLASLSYSSGSVYIFLNNGDGTYPTSYNYGYTSGTNPYGVVTADFNNDGNLDLAVANYGANPGTVSIYQGNGNGSFTAKTALTTGTGTNPSALVVGDFNGDGKKDLAVANYTSGTISIFAGNNDMTFTAQTPVSVGVSPRAITSGDFDGDGNLDLATANVTANSVSIFLGNGDGTFDSATSLVTGTSPFSIVSGDINADGKADLLVANYGSNSVSVFLGNGDSTFSTGTTYTTGASPRSVALGDLNNDGSLDIVTANYNDTSLSIFLVSLVSTPSAPAAPIIATANSSIASVSWTAVTGASSYKIYRGTTSSSGAATEVTSTCTFSGASATCPGLVNGVVYYFFIKAVNVAGESGFSSPSNGVTPPPEAPYGLTATSGDEQLSLSWIAPSGPIIKYKVYRGVTAGFALNDLTNKIAEPITNSFVDAGLINSTAYYYRVKAVNSSGDSPASSEVSATPYRPCVVPLIDTSSAAQTIIVANDVTYYVDLDGIRGWLWSNGFIVASTSASFTKTEPTAEVLGENLVEYRFLRSGNYVIQLGPYKSYVGVPPESIFQDRRVQ